MNYISVPYQFVVLWKKFEKRDGPVSQYENFEYTHLVCVVAFAQEASTIFSRLLH